MRVIQTAESVEQHGGRTFLFVTVSGPLTAGVNAAKIQREARRFVNDEAFEQCKIIAFDLGAVADHDVSRVGALASVFGTFIRDRRKFACYSASARLESIITNMHLAEVFTTKQKTIERYSRP